MNGSAPRLTIDELSAQADVPVTTLRMYQQRRLLEPPERVGRVGYYGATHVDRLRLIAQLQGRGYSLAAIGDLLKSDGAALRTLLGDAVPWLADDQPVTLSLSELWRRLPAADFSPDLIDRARSLGLIELSPEGVVVRHPTFLDVGSTLVQLGVPSVVVLDAYERLRSEIEPVADEFVAIYDEHIAAADRRAVDVETVTAQLNALADAAVTVVSSELRRALRVRAEERLEALRKPPTPTRPKSGSRRPVKR